MSNSNVNKWLKSQNINTEAVTKKYVLHRPNGERTVIRYAYLEALCRKHFDEKASIAIEKLLAGQPVITTVGRFSLEFIDDAIPVSRPIETEAN